MPALNRLEARTDNNSLRAAYHLANRAIQVARDLADEFFGTPFDHFTGPTALEA
jgi:hypothetical protein